MSWTVFRKNKGITLIELLIVLVLSSILIAALYRMFISQQKTYTVQEQVVDMQQNVRLAMDQMAREIRMTGYGKNILSIYGNVNGFTKVITAVNNANLIGKTDDSITIIIADEVAKLTQNAAKGSLQLDVSSGNEFDNDKKKYLYLDGSNGYLVQGVSGNTITLTTPLAEDHLENEPVFLVKAVTYKLQWDTSDTAMPVLVKDENTGSGGQVIADYVENLQFRYTLSDGTVMDSPSNPENIRVVRVSVTARTKMTDPELSGDGYRRRELASDIKVRNLGL
jgi:prepilin-type N-terminal cleavage/methylation domain-containing protein